jgi:hypothetical protein
MVTMAAKIHATNPIKKYTPPALTFSFSHFPATSYISAALEIKSAGSSETQNNR